MANSRDVTEPVVKVNGQVRPDLHCRSVERTMGGQRLDQAILELDLSEPMAGRHGRGDLLHNLRLAGSDLVNTQVTVERYVGKRLRCEHWGVVSAPKLHSSRDGISLVLASRLEPHHFGEPLRGVVVRDRQPSGGIRSLTIDEPLVFNPLRDGKRVANMSAHRATTGHRYVLDVESSASTRSLAWLGEGPPQPFTLAEAALYLMWTCNYSQRYVENWRGVPLDLEYFFDRQEVINVSLPQGKFLPELLDLLLEPYGYTWYVEHHSTTRRRIAFARLASPGSLPIDAKVQPAGQAVDMTKTNCEEFDLDWDVAKNLVNRVTVLADYEYVEAAFELVKSWPTSLDELDPMEDLAEGSDAWLANPAYRDVWRKWVLNEDGSYIGVRPEITKPFDFASLFVTPGLTINPHVPIAVRRRRFYPCITTNDDGTPAGKYEGLRIQWHDQQQWQEWPAGESWGVLDRECGVIWNGVMPPSTLVAMASQARLRVVATIRSDERVRYVASARRSVNAYTVPVILDAAHRFQFRRVHPSSPHYAGLFAFVRTPAAGEPAPPPTSASKPLKSTQVDDTLKLRDFGERALAAWNRADCTGPVLLTGTDHDEIELGNSVPAIAGRNIHLALAHEGQRFPLVMAIKYDFQQQQTILTLDTVREEIQFT